MRQCHVEVERSEDRFSVGGNHSKTLAAIVVSFIGLGGYAPHALAQTSTAAAPSDSLQEIVVTAGRREEKLGNVGEGISAVTGDELDTRAANSLEDIMALVPGLNVQSYGTPGYGSIAVRGISPQSVGASTAIYIDDIPFGGTSALSEGGDFIPDLDPADLERVEVLKGPQGTLYGASSLGGVIKYVTKAPSLTKTEITTSEDFNIVEGGSPGGKVRASISTPLIDDMLAIRIGAYSQYIGGYIDDLGLGGNDVNRGHDEGFRASLLYQPLENLKIRLNGSIQNSFVNGYATVDYNGATLQPLYGDLEQKRYTPETFRMDTHMYSAEVQWDTAFGSLISATSYSAFEPENGSDLTYFYAGLVPYISLTMPAGGLSNHNDSQTTQELRFTSNRLGIVEFIAGGFYQHENLHDLQHYYTYNTTGQIDTSVIPLALSYHTGTLAEYAGFGDATIYITPRFDVTVGTRHSETDQTRQQYTTGILYEPDEPPGYTYTSNQKFTESSNTYLAGLRWRITDDIMVYGRAASGYRPGGGRSVPPGFPAGFSDVYTSDSIWSYEAGIKIRAMDGRLTVDADTFWINWTNIQTLITVGAFDTDGNAGTARSRGAELQLAYIPFDRLTVGGNAAYTDARFTEDNASAGVTNGERLFFVPDFTATAYVDYSWPGAWKPSLGAEYDYRSSQLDVTRFTLPGYSTVGAHGGIQHDNQTIVMYIKNLANERGLIGSQGYAPGSAFPVAITQPRTFGITFTQKF